MSDRAALLATVSARTVDRLLRTAGHPRHDGRTRMTRYSPGYVVDEPAGDPHVIVGWDGGYDDRPDHARAALARLAVTLTRAGYWAAEGDQVVPLDDGEFRWPCLIVTSGEAAR